MTMPANPNTDTHYTTGITAGETGTTSNSATTNGNTFIKIKDNSTHRGQIKIVGSGATTVTSDANGVITINSTDNNTTYGSMSVSEGTTGTATTNRVLTAANLKGVINAHAPTKTGGGASGTWGISVSGNANSASKVNNKLTVGSKSYDGSAAVTIAASDLGLASAMLFLGTTTTAITDGATTNPITVGGASKTVTAGNVVLYGSKEFVWTGSAWEELGNEGSYKIVQAAVADPSASGTSNTFIATISQDTNGKITATKKTVAVTNSAPTLSWGATSTVGSVAGTNLQVKMPANPNTDTKVKQTVTTSNATYPLLLAPSGQTATSTTTSYFDSGVTLNPNTNTITANISGTAATATKATQDGNGNIISSTYLPLSAGENKKLTGPLGLTENINYGTSLPDNGFDGQLFFLEDDSPSLPVGGTVGQVLTKNSSIDGDAGWATDIAGNAATATKLKTARTIQTNLASTTSASFNGSANITPGVTGTLGVGNGGTGSTTKKGAWSNLIPYYDAPWSTIAEDTGNNWASLGNSSVTWWPENANGIYNKPSSWGLAFTISAGPSGSQEMHQLWFSQANGSIYHRGGNGATASSMEANSWAKLWQTGDSVTGAVWNDYAEYRESDCGEFGYVLMETGDDSLTKTTERLSHFAGVSSDTWGFSQGETVHAHTPIAVAGRVLVYPYQDRNNYKPGDCVCAAPDGTVDIMTREEVREWPDRIVGTVSCVPDYEEWGGGESADRDPVKVNGRIWIKVV